MVIVAAVAVAVAITLPLPVAPATVAADRVPVSAIDLVEVSEIGPPALSPDGKRVAYRIARPSVADNRVRIDWYVAEVDDRRPLHVGSGGAAPFEGSGALAEQQPVWDRDSRGLRFRARVDGVVAIWHWRADAGLVREIVDDADILDFTLSDDGTALRYTVGASRADVAAAERKAYAHGVLVDRHLDMMQPVAGGAVEDGKRIMQRLPTEWFERERLLWDTPRRQIIVSIAGGETGTSPIFTPPAALQGKEVPSRDGTAASISKSGTQSAVRLSRGDRVSGPCKVPVCRSKDLAALAWTPGGDALLLFERAGRAREKIWLWKPAAAAARLIATSDGAERAAYRAPRCVAAREAIICNESGPLAPPRIVKTAYGDGHRTVLADPNLELRSRIRARAEVLEPEAGLSAVLLRPARSREPLPLVVQYYHCAGFLKGGVGDEIPMLPLVENGIAVLCMDRRHRTGDAASRSAQALGATDVGNMIDRLAAKGVIDPRRVGIGGLSFGSEVALAAIHKPGRFAAATIASGQISPIYYWANALPGRGFTGMLGQYWQIGDPDSDRDRWNERLPTANPSAITTPLLMQLPEAEARYMIEFHTKLKLAGRAAEMIVFADEPHIKNQPVHKRAVYERNLDWYRFWLKDEEDPDPAKREQFARWRSLRSSQPSGSEPRSGPSPEAAAATLTSAKDGAARSAP